MATRPIVAVEPHDDLTSIETTVVTRVDPRTITVGEFEVRRGTLRL